MERKKVYLLSHNPRDIPFGIFHTNTLVYFIHGSIPQQGLKAETQGLKEELLLEKKETTSIQELCESLPEEFAMYLKHVRTLSFNQTTNYGHLYDLFSKLLRRKGYDHDHVSDMAELKFLERLQGKEKNI